jgi:hypothetical protein
MQLARIDGQHFITACRHGLVHVTWGRTTTRFSRDEFRRLAALLEKVSDAQPPNSAGEGDVRVTCRADEECEVRVGLLALLLSPTEFQYFVEAATKAVHRLDEILASGLWDKPEPEESPAGILERLRQFLFSQN